MPPLAAAGRDDQAQGVCQAIMAHRGHLGCIFTDHCMICFSSSSWRVAMHPEEPCGPPAHRPSFCVHASAELVIFILLNTLTTNSTSAA